MRDKRQKFIELAESRVNRAIKDLRLIGNLANTNSYEYSESDAKEIFKALQTELDTAKSRFTGGGRTGADSFRLSSK
ncbi:MAG: hypothetical protein ACTS1Z_15030 [Parasphingopyxis sp.]|uniref:hypothetical protein n=1 Tax=Parasphingopyxis sp. TaxID=1920299 RepID=UPI003F9EEBDA